MPKPNEVLDDELDTNEDVTVDEGFVDTNEDTSEEDLDESAADTLRPMGGSGGGETRAQMLSTFVQLMSQLGKEDLSKFNDMAQAQFGPSKAPGAEDKSGTNKGTISAKSSAAKGTGPIPPMPMPHLGIKEDMDEMFSGDDLSEDFKERASVVFEAAFNTRVNLELVRLAEEYETLESELNEQYEEKLNEATDKILEDLTDKLDQYLDYVVEEWMRENELAVETSLRTEVAESFIESLKGVFQEHYVDMPEERFDIVNELKVERDQLAEQLSRTLDEKIALENEVNEAVRETVLEDATDGLSVAQSEKLRTLSEGLEFTDAETYRAKLDILRENFFSGDRPKGTGLLNEEIDGTDTTQDEEHVAPEMRRYVDVLSRASK